MTDAERHDGATEPVDPAVVGRPADPEVTDPGAADPGAESDGALVAFKSREFTTFWVAGLISNTGTWMQTVTVPYVVDQLTHSTALVGVAAFCTYFPATLVSPIAGSLSDRRDRRAVLIWAQVVMMAMATALWALWSSGSATTVLILVCVVISALGNGITIAAWQSYVPQLVPRGALLSAVRLNSMQFTGARAFGPALAGLILATLGPSAAFGINAISFLVVIGALMMLTPRPPVMVGAQGSVIQHFREGLRYLRRRQVFVVSVLMVFFVAMFGVGLVQLVEPFTRHVLDVGAGVYGLLTAGYGGGAVVGSLFMVWFGDSFRRSHFTMVGVVAMVVGVVALGLSPAWGFALAALFLMGIAQVFCTVSCNTALQLNVDEGFRGRVSSLFLMSFFAAAPLGALVGGVTGQLVGLRATIVGAAVLLAAVSTWMVLHYHRLHPLDEAVPIADSSEETDQHGRRPLPVDLDTAGHLRVEVD
ncbi:MAG TPA: MFS transporter [Acidimicrobiia bacterium]|nr:MFS transporter [Acidimicrobiia bacterium]